MKTPRLLLGLVVLAGGGCAHTPTSSETVFDAPGAVQSRAYQERAFDTIDQRQALRSILVTAQELGFIVTRADAELGVITAVKMAWFANAEDHARKANPAQMQVHTLRATFTARSRGAQTIVRVTADYSIAEQLGGGKALARPELYQPFFAALSRSLFLEARPVNEEGPAATAPGPV